MQQNWLRCLPEADDAACPAGPLHMSVGRKFFTQYGANGTGVTVGNGVGCGAAVGVCSTIVGVAANGLAGSAGRLSQAPARMGSISTMKHADHPVHPVRPTASARRADSPPDCTVEAPARNGIRHETGQRSGLARCYGCSDTRARASRADPGTSI